MKKEMKKWKKNTAAGLRSCCMTGIAGLLLALALPSGVLAAEPSKTGPAGEGSKKEAEPMQPYSGDVNTLKAAEGASQLMIVIGNPEDPAKGNLSWYKRQPEDGRLQRVLSVEAVSGMNGITADKEEGDKKTPCGVYSFPMAFGMKENPGSILPYHQIKEGDHYVDDSSSRYYNRLVNEQDVERDWNSSEVLITQAPQYNYGLVLNYNEDCVPGKGSAIFLHCPKSSNNTGTSGCISIPEEYMKQIVCTADADTRIIVVAKEADLAAY